MASLSSGEPLASRKVKPRARGRIPKRAAQGAGEHESTEVLGLLKR